MNAFSYTRCDTSATPADVTRHFSERGAFLAGGTTLLDLAKLRVVQPERLIDINRLQLDRIQEFDTGGLRLGATVRNSVAARDPRVRQRFPVLAEAILNGASAQIRNMATTAGNILQRTRCPYFRDNVSPCNKRVPGSGCAARAGYHRGHAILGTSEACIAVHPSDLCISLAVLDAVVTTQQEDRVRRIPFGEFHLLPRDTPEKENVLTPGELITAVEISPLPAGARSWYVKARDRASYEFALASAAVVLRVDAGRVAEIRIALGGVATKPWRCPDAENFLHGKPPTGETFSRAASIALESAELLPDNAFKRPLMTRVLVHTLETLARGQPAVREI